MALPWQDQETDRPAWRRNKKASCGVSRIRWMPWWAWSITSARVGTVRLASSTALRLDHKPSTGLSSGA